MGCFFLYICGEVHLNVSKDLASHRNLLLGGDADAYARSIKLERIF